jgi:hypothetical protein
MNIPWEDIVEAARLAAKALPPPFNIVADLALVIARGFIRTGCTIDGCPPEVSDALITAPIPAEDVAFFKARGEAEARIRGLTHEAFDAIDAEDVYGK